MVELEGKITLITGAAKGLGKYLSLKLAEEGCNLVICDINEVGIINTRNEVKSKTGKKVIAAKVDITDEKDVKDMVDIAV